MALPTPQTHPPITEQEFIAAAQTNMLKVNEFRFIREHAQKMGVQVWLFGGTAAAYAHYVKWDLQRKLGDQRFQADRFDYSYSNIFRSTQDLDLVIDGTPEQASELENLLTSKFQYVVGGKSAWEVRLLRQGVNEKESLLDNPEMTNQHSDSHSTGLIEVSESQQPPVKDIRAWNSKKPPFLTDVLNDEITYYFSELHRKTKMADRGDNPDIISVVRLLTKAYQYELKISNASMTYVRRVIREFDPIKHLETSYAQNRLEKVAINMIRHAVNMEYAANQTTALGLKSKLLRAANKNSVNSMAWWLERKPLASFPLNRGPGQTAKELGLDILAHETSSFEAYESITRSHTGTANVFTSRKNAEGEAAIYGEGFYTQSGTKGARGTKLTIRFKIHPEARLDVDFFCPLGRCSMVVITNKNVLQVIPETLNLSVLEYFEFLTNGSINTDEKAQLEKFKRKLRSASEMTPRELQDIKTLFKKLAAQFDLNARVLEEWFALPVSQPQRIGTLVRYINQWKNLPEGHKWNHRSNPQLANILELADPELEHSVVLEKALATGNTEFIRAFISSSHGSKYLAKYPASMYSLPQRLLKKCSDELFDVIRSTNSNTYFDTKFLIRLYDSARTATLNEKGPIIFAKMKVPHLSTLKDFLVHDDHSKRSARVIKSLASQSRWYQNPKVIKILHKQTSDENASELLTHLYSKPHLVKYDHYVFDLLEKGTTQTAAAVITYLLSQPHWQNRDDIFEAAFQVVREDKYQFAFTSVIDGVFETLALPRWRKHLDLIREIQEKSPGSNSSFIRHILSVPELIPHFKDIVWNIFEDTTKRQDYDSVFIEEGLAKSDWSAHPDLLSQLILRNRNNAHNTELIISKVLTKPEWQNHFESIQKLIFIDQNKENEDVQKILVSTLFPDHFQDTRFLWFMPMAKSGSASLVRSLLGDIFLTPKLPPTSEAIDFINILLNRVDKKDDCACYQRLADVLALEKWKDNHKLIKRAFHSRSQFLLHSLVERTLPYLHENLQEEIIDSVLSEGSHELVSLLIEFVLPDLRGPLAENTISRIMGRQDFSLDRLVLDNVLIPNQNSNANPYWVDRFDLAGILLKRGLFKRNHRRHLFSYLVGSPDFTKYPEFLRKFLATKPPIKEIEALAPGMITSNLWLNHSDLVQQVLSKLKFNLKGFRNLHHNAFIAIQSFDHKIKRDFFVTTLLKMNKSHLDLSIATHLMSEKFFQDENWTRILIERGSQKTLFMLWENVFKEPFELSPEMMVQFQTLLKRLKPRAVSRNIETLLELQGEGGSLSKALFANSELLNLVLDVSHPDLLAKLMESGLSRESSPNAEKIINRAFAADKPPTDRALARWHLSRLDQPRDEVLFTKLTERCLRNRSCNDIFDYVIKPQTVYRNSHDFATLLRHGLSSKGGLGTNEGPNPQVLVESSLDLWNSDTIFTAIESKRVHLVQELISTHLKNPDWASHPDYYRWVHEILFTFPGVFDYEFLDSSIKNLEDPQQLEVLERIVTHQPEDLGIALGSRYVGTNYNGMKMSLVWGPLPLNNLPILLDRIIPRLQRSEILTFLKVILSNYSSRNPPEPLQPEIIDFILDLQENRPVVVEKGLFRFRFQQDPESYEIFVTFVRENAVDNESYENITQEIIHPRDKNDDTPPVRTCPLK